MAIIPLILGHLKIAGYILAALAVAIFVAWIGHLIEAHKRDQAALIVASQQLHTAEQTNADNVAAFDRFKEDTARAQAAVAESAVQSQKRTVAIAKIRQENSRAPASPTDPIGTHVRDVIAGLRDLKAARVADKDTGGKGHDP